MHDEVLHHYSYGGGHEPRIHTEGNRIVGDARNGDGYVLTHDVAAMNADNYLSWKWFIDDVTTDRWGLTNRGDPLPSEFRADTPFRMLGRPFPIQSAEEAFADVITDVGANARLDADGERIDATDALDAMWLQQVRSGEYADPMPTSAYVVPPIAGGDPYPDSDGDGMPDPWEASNGFDPETADGSGDADGDGYTNLEEFLNLVDAP